MTALPDHVERWSTAYHAPVLITEVLHYLHGARRVLDGTLGGGGHTAALLDTGASVTGLDRDPTAIASTSARLATFIGDGHLEVVQANYADLAEASLLPGRTWDGILLDLGVSSHQLDDEGRGFSFREGAPLDMRMGFDAERTAADVLNEADVAELREIFRSYGDERRAARLASEVERRRQNRPFETSDDFVGAIRAVLGPRSGAPDFARLFQALRIAVNEEITRLEAALPALRDRLSPAGALVVIAYHSGEDRVVKHAFREWSRDCVCPPEQPYCTCRGRALGETLTRKPVTAGDAEVAANPRARSARLRAWRLA